MATPGNTIATETEHMTPGQILESLGITQADLTRVAAYWEYVAPRMDDYIDAWMQWMQTQEAWRRFFSTNERLELLRDRQRDYWERFFAGKVDDDYIKHRQWVGDANAKIGLTPNSYLGSINASLQIFTEDIYDGDGEEPAHQSRTLSMYKLAQVDSIIGAASFVKRSEQIIREQHEAMLEMSTPVSEIREDVLLLPLVGIIDSKRAQEIMTAVLTKISQSHAKSLIIDIKGVAVVDTAVANHLIKITKAARLMGCESTISCLSPAIAQTIVELGIDVSNVRTTSKLKNALDIAFTRNR